MSIMKLVPDTGSERPAAQIAGKVRAVMAEHRLSSARVAKAIGMTQPAFSRRYSGELDWSLDQLAALAQAFGMSFNDLCAIRDLNPEPADSMRRSILQVVDRIPIGPPVPAPRRPETRPDLRVVDDEYKGATVIDMHGQSYGLSAVLPHKAGATSSTGARRQALRSGGAA